MPTANDMRPESEVSSPSLVRRLRRQTYLFLPCAVALVRGFLFKMRALLSLGRLSVSGFPRIYGKFYVTGPGRVRIGRSLYVDGRTIKPVSLSTVRPDAEILVGDNCGFNGTSVRCHKRISVGDFSNIADAYIVDSPSHRISADRRMFCSEDIEGVPVSIGRNVWISVNVVVLHGVAIGDDCVIGACSLVRKDVPPNMFAAGNPLRVIRNIENDGPAG